jgi:hypothetical protein
VPKIDDHQEGHPAEPRGSLGALTLPTACENRLQQGAAFGGFFIEKFLIMFNDFEALGRTEIFPWNSINHFSKSSSGNTEWERRYKKLSS